MRTLYYNVLYNYVTIVMLHHVTFINQMIFNKSQTFLFLNQAYIQPCTITILNIELVLSIDTSLTVVDKIMFT